MSLIKCPECGREISNQAKFCPNCGYQIPQFRKYKKQTFEDIKGEIETRVFGNKDIECPVCGSKYFDIANDIPIYKKIFEVWIIGTIMPQTKSKYRDGMIYHCRKCDTVWDNGRIMEKGDPNGYKPSSSLPITVGILSILFSFVLFALSFTATIATVILLLVSSVVMLAGGIVSLTSMGKSKVVNASCILYEISMIGLLIVFLLGGANILSFLISGVFFWCMRLYEKKLS